MRRSAADGNHMRRRISLSITITTRVKRRQRREEMVGKWRQEAGEEGGVVRGGGRKGGRDAERDETREVEIIKRQSAASGAQHVRPIWR